MISKKSHLFIISKCVLLIYTPWTKESVHWFEVWFWKGYSCATSTFLVNYLNLFKDEEICMAKFLLKGHCKKGHPSQNEKQDLREFEQLDFLDKEDKFNNGLVQLLQQYHHAIFFFFTSCAMRHQHATMANSARKKKSCKCWWSMK